VDKLGEEDASLLLLYDLHAHAHLHKRGRRGVWNSGCGVGLLHATPQKSSQSAIISCCKETEVEGQDM
jgi:hypothetical protein